MASSDRRGGWSRGRSWVPRRVRSTIVTLVLVALVPMLVLQGFIYWIWYTNRLEEVQKADLELARAVAVDFDSYLGDLFRQQHTLARALPVLEDPSEPQIDRLLRASQEQYESVQAIDWVDGNGHVIASSDPAMVGLDVSDRSYFQTLQRGPDRIVSNLLTSKTTGEPVFVVGQRIQAAAGQPLAILLTVVRPEGLGRSIMNIRLAPSDLLTLFDAQGTIVFSNDTQWIGMSMTAQQDEPLYTALAGQEASGRFISPLANELRLAARVPVGATGWVAGISVSLARVAAPLRRGITVASTGMAAVAVLCALLALLISRRISVPLDRLRRHAHEIGAGHLDQRVRSGGLTELEDLAHALNRMSEQLAEARAGLERSNADLRRSNRDLEQFAYIASHDLQEPLRAVAGFVTLLKHRYAGRLDEKADSYIAAAVEGAARMQTLINGLLEYSRVGTRGAPPAPTRAEEALHEALQNLQVPIDESGATITSDSLPIVQADAAQLTHVFQNLIANAIKFRSERPLAIHVGAERQDGFWRFFVRDNGIGIEPQYYERIFLIFQRLHTRSKYPGTGIGLAISKRIVERHGGSIWVESRPDQGSTFYFTLPEEGATHGQSPQASTD